MVLGKLAIMTAPLENGHFPICRMLLRWYPVDRDNNQYVTPKDAWSMGHHSHTRRNKTDAGHYLNFEFLHAYLKCDKCQYNTCPSNVIIGDMNYNRRIASSNDYWEHEFILYFAWLLFHHCHKYQMTDKAFSKLKLDVPFFCPVSFREGHLLQQDVVSLTHSYKHVVSLFYKSEHYCVCKLMIKERRLIIFDGLNWEFKNWCTHISFLLRKLAFVDVKCENWQWFPDVALSTKTANTRREKIMIPGYFIHVDRVQWRVQRGSFLTQTDGFNCGPIACLKLIHLYHLTDEDKAKEAYNSMNIRNLVVQDWEYLVEMCNDDIMVKLQNTNTNKGGEHKPSSLDVKKSNLDDKALDMSDTEGHVLQMKKESLFFPLRSLPPFIISCIFCLTNFIHLFIGGFPILDSTFAEFHRLKYETGTTTVVPEINVQDGNTFTLVEDIDNVMDY